MMFSVSAHLQSYLDRLVAEGREQGLQLTVYRHGKILVDLCSGLARPATGEPVTPSTLFPVFSVTKGITATLVHRLVGRGAFNYDTPIAALWPEFAAHGKASITVGHALSHRSGIPHMPAELTYRDVCSWATMCAAVADLTPVAPPGSDPNYHALTYGWILGEVTRRADGQSFGERLRREIQVPLGLENLQVGVSAETLPRIARLQERFAPGTAPSGPNDLTPQSVPSWMQPLSNFMNRADTQQACMPGVNGIMNARDLARFYAALLPGGVDGVELLSPAAVQRATAETGTLPPAVEGGLPRRLGLGYFLGGAGCAPNMGSRPDAFGHVGYGGAVGYADPQTGVAVGLTKNSFSPEAAHNEILAEVRRCVDLSASRD